MNSLNTGEVKSSAGFDGLGPHGMIDNPSTAVAWIASLISASCEMIEASPTVEETSKILCRRGFRRSASIKTHLRPDCAMETARLATTVLLPSEAWGLVI